MKLRAGFLYFGLLLAVVAIVGMRYFGFVAADVSPPHWDHAAHILNGYDYLETISSRPFQTLALYRFYPPLVYVLFALISAVISDPEKATVILNAGLFTALGVVLFRFRQKTLTVWHLLTEAWVLLVVFFVFPFPSVYPYELMLDYPLAVCVFIVYLLLRPVHRGSVAVNVFLLSLTIACAFLMKWSAFVYLLCPLLWNIFAAGRIHAIKTAAVFGLSALAASLWYAPHLLQLIRDIRFFAITQGAIDADPQFIASLGFYIRTYFNAATPVILATATSGLLVAAREGGRGITLVTPARAFDVLFITVPVIIFAFFVPNKDPRYLYPAYVIGVYCVWRSIIVGLRQKQAKSVALVTGVALAFFGPVLPEPLSQPFGAGLLDQVVTLSAPVVTGYFFERDAKYFNYVNVALYYRLRNGREGSEYVFLNTFTGNPGVCRTDLLPETLLVYDNLLEHLTVGPRISFEVACPLLWRSHYGQVGIRTSESGDVIRIYRRI